MRFNLRAVSVLSISALALASCASSPDTAAHADAPAPSTAAADAESLPLTSTEPIAWDAVAVGVNGMSCPKCAENIGKSLTSIDAVASADVNLELGDVRVVFVEGSAHPSAARLATVIRDAGFTPVRVTRVR